MEEIELSKIHPAPYNPRILSDEAFRTLRDSIRDLGVIKPILVNAGNHVIVAGHQRTKTMLAMEITKAPCYLLRGLSEEDEIRFNQIHNQCEYEINDRAPKVRIVGTLALGYNRVANNRIVLTDAGSLNTYGNILGKMITKFGEFCAPVSDEQGNIIISAGYARAAKLLGLDLDIFVIPNEKKELALHYFSRDYGQFCYDNLPKKTYHQTFAQMFRLRGGKKENNSTLYVQRVFPFLKAQPGEGKSLRILDFGAGQYDFAKALERQGYNITYVDPYHRCERSSKLIDYKGNRKGFLKICDDLLEHGLYDVVICDSVLNSVDSVEAERSVIDSVFGLCKPQGTIFISGRLFEKSAINDKTRGCSISYMDSQLKFFDKNGFTGLFRNGNWFYQRLHKKAELPFIGRRLSTAARIYTPGMVWHIVAKKDIERSEEEIIRGLRFEFNLPLPRNKRYDLQDRIEQAYRGRK